MAASLVIRQQIAQRPGASHYDSHPRELKFAKGSLLSFALHSTSYEDDAAVIRIPPGVKLCLSTACVGRKEWEEFTRTSSARAVVLKFSSEENGEMLALWTHDRDRSGDVCQTGLGVEGASVYSSFVAYVDDIARFVLICDYPKKLFVLC